MQAVIDQPRRRQLEVQREVQREVRGPGSSRGVLVDPASFMEVVAGGEVAAAPVVRRPRASGERHLRLVPAAVPTAVAAVPALPVITVVPAVAQVAAVAQQPAMAPAAPQAGPVSQASARGRVQRRRAVARRRRLLVGLVVVGASVAGISVAAASTRSATPPVVSPIRQHVIAPGESLWSIARELQPSGDVRPLVHRLEQANGGVVNLQVGSVLVLP